MEDMNKIDCLLEIQSLLLYSKKQNSNYRLFKYNNNYHYIDNYYYSSGDYKKYNVEDENGKERIEFQQKNQSNVEIVNRLNVNILIDREKAEIKRLKEKKCNYD